MESEKQKDVRSTNPSLDGGGTRDTPAVDRSSMCSMRMFRLMKPTVLNLWQVETKDDSLHVLFGRAEEKVIVFSPNRPFRWRLTRQICRSHISFKHKEGRIAGRNGFSTGLVSFFLLNTK